ncbi:MAG: glyoxalase/bleomycin resistance/extradiol dioxygenase family protein [Hyphomicrobiales bacterium]|nr:glyoxalase/bleomycin resistance/extradiol dioxygenase family protein [Hyphomicrobiales bacterium]
MNLQPTEILPLAGVLETAIYADDLEQAKAFYGGLPSLEGVRAKENCNVFYSCGATVVLIFDPVITKLQTLDARLPVPPRRTIGTSHICFSAPGNQIDKRKTLLQKSDIQIESEITWHNGARSVYFRDPAGNSLEFAQPRLWGYEEKDASE